MQEQIIFYIFIGIIAVTVFIGLYFIIRIKDNENIIYNKELPIWGSLFSAAFIGFCLIKNIILPFHLLFGAVICCALMNVSPLLYHTVFNDSYFEKTFFVFKKKYYYEDINSCSYRYVSSKNGGHSVYTFHLENGKEIRFGVVTNLKKFIKVVSKKYKELHNGEEIPGFGSVAEYIKDEDKTDAKEKPVRKIPDSGFIRPAKTESEGTVFLTGEVDGHKAVYRRYGFKTELVIDGYVYAEYENPMDFPHMLCATVGGHSFRAEYNGRARKWYLGIDGVYKQKTMDEIYK